jgi:hypothetical protein
MGSERKEMQIHNVKTSYVESSRVLGWLERPRKHYGIINRFHIEYVVLIDRRSKLDSPLF